MNLLLIKAEDIIDLKFFYSNRNDRNDRSLQIQLKTTRTVLSPGCY